MHLKGQIQEGADCPSWSTLDSLYKDMPWFKFLGYVNLILGIVLSLPVVTLLFTWVFIWIGLVAIKSSRSFMQGYENHDAFFAKEGLGELIKLVRICSILSLVSLVLFVLMIFIMIMVFIFSPSILS